MTIYLEAKREEGFQLNIMEVLLSIEEVYKGIPEELPPKNDRFVADRNFSNEGLGRFISRKSLETDYFKK